MLCPYLKESTIRDLFFVERFSFLRVSKCTVGIILGPFVVSFVGRIIMLCPYLIESTIRGLTTPLTVS